MKKLALICCIICTSVTLQAQTAKWFVGFPTGYVMGGPASSLKSLMADQGYDQSASDLIGHVNYPLKTYIPPLLVIAGKQISTYGSLYVLLGQSYASTVEGYNGIASIDVHYNILQGTLGYQFTFPQTHFKIGIGPSLFIFHYDLVNYVPAPPSAASQYSPGLSLMARMPFGKEKKLFGVELFFAMNVAESVHINDISENINYEEFEFSGGKLSMVNAMLGLNFVFRK
jgi:hypothetical protein